MRRLLLTALVALLVPAATASAGIGRVVIRRTPHGIPHIEAHTFGGAGYGYGYAFARDNLCTIAEDYVTVDAQRARYFGPQGSYEQRGAGVTVNNLDSDVFWQDIIDSGRVERLRRLRPPNGPLPAIRQVMRGYVAGYNRYLAHVGGRDGVPDPRCRGKAWVRPISVATAYRRIYQLVLLASSDVAIQGIANSSPPAATAARAASRRLDAGALIRALWAHPVMQSAGSNAVAVGSAGTRDHRHGLLLGNPHFPWIGPERFYQAQVTISGRMNVSGVSLYGVPAILIGHTRTMAWSHTVSTAFRFTPYELALAPGKPTSYVVDGHQVAMTKHTVTVRSRGAGGALEPVHRTLYSTRWGPVFNTLQGFSLPWTTKNAFALRDANASNFRLLNHFLETDMARSVPEELRILKRYEGIPWVNTIVADRAGRALYADIGTVPHVTNDEAKRCNTPLGSAAFAALGLPILDGSRSSCRWGSDPDAAVPGIFGASRLPSLERSDYVTNSNDSYWLSNPHHPLEGFSRIIGDERTPRSLRTRIGLIMTQARVDGTDGLGPAGFTRADMQRMVFSNRQYAGELTRDALVGVCRSLPGGKAPTSTGAPVAVGDACDVLARWDLRENLDSRGAILFRRFWDHAPASPFAQPFSPADPVNTPRALDTSLPAVKTALGDAIADLRGAGIALDARVGDVQGVTRRGTRIPLHGGPGDPNGEFNAIYAPFAAGRGFGEVEDGSSFVQVVTWGAGRCPDAATILTYSQSENPRSRFNSDQTRLFSRKRWLTDRFCSSDVRRHTVDTTVLERGRIRVKAG